MRHGFPPARHEACGNTIEPKPFMRIFGLLWIALDCPCGMKMALVIPDPGGV